ncbi:hypothetical protein P5673_025368 [Acropora cervicornis]|uniref:Uncharacterized protein n=1 Tax=Acropora cervicornis TaxID=6130 RepID=A0AAD9Q2X8_ACRCE|nr:hypothetical protein P5673_025368 [Acropora cervicornis]
MKVALVVLITFIACLLCTANVSQGSASDEGGTNFSAKDKLNNARGHPITISSPVLAPHLWLSIELM